MKTFLILLLAISAQGSELVSAKEASKEAHKIIKDRKGECVKEWSDDINDKINKAIEQGDCDQMVFMGPDGGCVTKKVIANKVKELEKLDYTVMRYEPYGENYDVIWCTD
jgi:spore coat polysaccharide biosynthesis protein SpsF (cytidylyltransferase family)